KGEHDEQRWRITPAANPPYGLLGPWYLPRPRLPRVPPATIWRCWHRCAGHLLRRWRHAVPEFVEIPGVEEGDCFDDLRLPHPAHKRSTVHQKPPVEFHLAERS